MTESVEPAGHQTHPSSGNLYPSKRSFPRVRGAILRAVRGGLLSCNVPLSEPALSLVDFCFRRWACDHIEGVAYREPMHSSTRRPYAGCVMIARW